MNPIKRKFAMTLAKLQQQVAQLSPENLAEFRQWFIRFDGDHWDRQIERDASEGKLDSLAQDALKEFRSGQSRSEH